MWLQLLAAIGKAAVAANATKRGIEASGVAAARNLAEQNLAISEQERQANLAASERMTDRMREASRQLSLARVIAAEGGGGLRGRADNILAAMNEDLSRIGSTRDSQAAGFRQDAHVARTAFDAQREDLRRAGTAMRVRFLTEVAGAGMNAYAQRTARAADVRAVQNRTGDYTDPDKYRFGRGIKFGG